MCELQAVELQPSPAPVPIPEETLAAFGWTRVEVREGFCPETIQQVLADMRAEACVHSWVTFASLGPSHAAVDELIAWEQKKRPTTLFSYRGVDARGDEEVIAVGAVSERISAHFQHTGFPVIARCYVRRRFRGQRLYGALLGHRYRYCQRRWGAGLRAVHLGTANDAVHHVVSDARVVDPPFRKVAVEALHVDHEVVPVATYLAFQANYTAEALACLDPGSARSPALRSELALLQGMLRGLVDGAPTGDLHTLRDRLRAHARHPDATRISEPLEGLLAFCDAITPFAPSPLPTPALPPLNP